MTELKESIRSPVYYRLIQTWESLRLPILTQIKTKISSKVDSKKNFDSNRLHLNLNQVITLTNLNFNRLGKSICCLYTLDLG